MSILFNIDILCLTYNIANISLLILKTRYLISILKNIDNNIDGIDKIDTNAYHFGVGVLDINHNIDIDIIERYTTLSIILKIFLSSLSWLAYFFNIVNYLISYFFDIYRCFSYIDFYHNEVTYFSKMFVNVWSWLSVKKNVG